DHQRAGRVVGADDLGERQVPERRPYEHRPRDRPEKNHRLPVAPAEIDAYEPVQEERAEDPRREVDRREPAARADRQHDRDRSGRGENERDDAVDDLLAAEVGERLPENGVRPLYYWRSKIAAIPCPPPMHIVTSA